MEKSHCIYGNDDCKICSKLMKHKPNQEGMIKDHDFENPCSCGCSGDDIPCCHRDENLKECLKPRKYHVKTINKSQEESEDKDWKEEFHKANKKITPFWLLKANINFISSLLKEKEREAYDKGRDSKKCQECKEFVDYLKEAGIQTEIIEEHVIKAEVAWHELLEKKVEEARQELKQEIIEWANDMDGEMAVLECECGKMPILEISGYKKCIRDLISFLKS